MKQVWAVTRKELSAYFGSPLALIFLGTFLVVTLAAFFWVEGFFARGIADVRPLFRWMPVLLLFLVAALTMRQWSEEQRAGTLEVLLTLPVRPVALVVGKFLSVLILVALALALTLFLPITVALLGPLDWGPVIGGYLAALLLAAAYTAIGLLVSSRTDNQIVSLILTVLVAGFFYLIGSSTVTGLVGDTLADVLRGLGTGSRFESIERGVLDVRDLVYYLALTGIFITLNVLSLDAKRWSRGARTAPYRRQALLTALLIVANLVAINAWIFPLGGLRADLTAGGEYSLAPVTRDLIQNLQEPLLMRGYFSERTHPLLAPLVPSIRDMLREYEVASGGNVKVEIVDPQLNEEAEVEANQVYGIRPSPFRVSDRFEASVINSYFDILVRYGDQYETLGFADLIEIEALPDGSTDVRLRNPEYDLTRAIKKAVYGFQSLDSVFARLEEPVRLTAFVTPNSLPEGLAGVPQIIDSVAAELQAESGGKFSYAIVNPDAPGSQITRDTLVNNYGLYPIAASLFSSDSYYMHLVLEIGSQGQVLYPAADMTEADLRTELTSALQRAAPGFLKTVGLWTPTLQPQQDPFTGQMAQPLSSWNLLRQQLSQDYTVQTIDLSTGRVPGNIDVLVMVAPQGLADQQLFAVDQYLMRGGAVLVLGGSYALAQQQLTGGITMEQLQGTLGDVLASYGVEVGPSMVLDPQNEPFPMQVARQVGGMQVLEIQEVDYPYFVDVRPDNMSDDSAIVSNLPAVTLHWASPLTVTETAGEERQVTVLLQSTDGAWLGTSTDLQSNTELYPEYGFPVSGEPAQRVLGVAVRGTFTSFFKDRESPFEQTEVVTGTAGGPLGTITTSSPSAQLVVVSSAEFIDDIILNLSRSLSADRYLNNLQLVQNAVDWLAEDEDLLTIRTGGTYTRLLKPMEPGQQSVWEMANYGVALVALVAIAAVWQVRRRSEQPMELVGEEVEHEQVE